MLALRHGPPEIQCKPVFQDESSHYRFLVPVLETLEHVDP